MSRVLIFFFIIGTIACDDKKNGGQETLQPQAQSQPSASSNNESTTAEGTWEPAGEDGIVYHYICPDRCVGGVLDNEGNCPICGKPLQHNSAFHFNNNNPTETPAADLMMKPRNTAMDPAKSPNGFWHFTCPNGHDGAGEAGTCATCGEELLHNELYHTDSENDEPAQNATGVWHFICPNGHAGGAGAPVQCDECGATLEHNADYHS